MKLLISVVKILILLVLFTGTIHARTMTILVHPFNNTGDAKYSWLSAGITASVISDLGVIREVTVISETERKKAIAEISFAMSGIVDEEKAVKAGKMLGANVIFTGSYVVMDDNVLVCANLMDVEKGIIIKSVKIDGTVKGIFDLQDKIVFCLMAETEKVRIVDIKPPKLTIEDKKKIETAERPKLSAYELYAKGLEIEDTDPRGALDYYKQAIQIQPDYLDALTNAALTAAVELNLFDESIGYLKKADELYIKKRKTNTDAYAFLLNKTGMVYYTKGQMKDSLKYYFKAKKIMENLGLQNTSSYATLMNNVGCVHWSEGNLDNTLKYFLTAMKIEDYLGLQNTSGYASLMNNAGIIYNEKGQSDKAIEYYIKAKEIYVRLGLQHSSLYAVIMSNIGTAYRESGRFEKALKCYFESKEMMNKLGLDNKSNYARLMINLGKVYYEKGQLNSALGYFSESKAIWENLGMQNVFHYGVLLQAFASVYEKQGKKDLAGEFYRKAFNTYIKAGYSGKEKDKALKNAVRFGK